MDKFDLINWYFDKLLAKSFEHMGMGKTVYDALVKKYTYIQEEHIFFAAAFKYDNQNSLRQHDFELILAFYENLIREKTGRIPDETIHCILEMYCQSSIYMTVKWVLGDWNVHRKDWQKFWLTVCLGNSRSCLKNLKYCHKYNKLFPELYSVRRL